MELYLIRHPRPAVAPGVCYGQSDLPLAGSVEPDAVRLRALLPHDARVYCSPLRRAAELARALGRPREDPRLMELAFGEWEMQPYDRIGTALDGWADDPQGFRAPGGESQRELSARVLAWWDEVRTTAPERLVVVAHGGPLRVLAGHLLGLPPDRWLGLDFSFATLTRLDVESWGCVLRYFNR